ncbi:3'-5' exonuclease [Flavobacterium sp.]|uniref:3'-5' exonuclease n=1 Tax=Flavobacterium sp. TaxID=239 RepID=UPI003B9BD273
MLDWIKIANKNYPDFWKVYLSRIEQKPERAVALRLQTTGNDPHKDVILAISAVGMQQNHINAGDVFEVVLLQYVFNHDNGLSNEFIIESKVEKMLEPQAIEQFINYLGNAVIVGHQVNFDIEIINTVLEKLNCGRLRNEALDVDIMYKKYKDISSDKTFAIEEIEKQLKLPDSDKESTTDKAFALALIYQKLKHKLKL